MSVWNHLWPTWMCARSTVGFVSMWPYHSPFCHFANQGWAIIMSILISAKDFLLISIFTYFCVPFKSLGQMDWFVIICTIGTIWVFPRKFGRGNAFARGGYSKNRGAEPLWLKEESWAKTGFPLVCFKGPQNIFLICPIEKRQNSWLWQDRCPLKSPWCP